mmetsp:Transcript_20713/g.31753  ORF Transcript_20713/g.31753 Transcript_20713/m.31753 type:complete len:130 (-) Transcript_20713:5040-5429(-)
MGAKAAGYSSAKPQFDLHSASGNPKEVSKVFKRMLTSNHNRTNYSEFRNGTGNGNSNGHGDQTNDSTKYGGSAVRLNIDNITQISEIESKFTKKKSKHRKYLSKIYKDEGDIEANYLEDKYEGRVSNTT